MRNESGVICKETYILKYFCLILLGFLFSSIALAGDGSGVVQRIYVHEKNDYYGGETDVIMFAVTNHTDQPSTCTNHEWAFSITTEKGKAMYALLLSAAAQKQNLVIKGSGDCEAWNGRERPYYMYVDYN